MSRRRSITFKKTGSEIKTAIQNRIDQLQSRLDRRNAALEEFLQDKQLVRSYLLRNSQRRVRTHEAKPELYQENEISLEHMEEITRLCQRIYTIEAEVAQLQLHLTHLDEGSTFDLTTRELVAYGFEA